MIKKISCIVLALCFSVFDGMAQENLASSSLIELQDLESESELIVRALDSLTQLTFFDKPNPKNIQRLNKYGFKQGYVPTYPDSVYAFRIKHMGTGLNLTFNDYVKPYIDLYAVKRRSSTEKLLGLSGHYFPIFEEILEQYDLPHFLKYLAVVESALNPNAVSRVGATGIWQFMYSTGKMYNLNVNYFVDERRDPILASHAAAKFFKDLHAVYGDWMLVLAAYNCGPGNVNKAIRKAGGERDYWAIRKYLPLETRGYVPAFIAATYVMHYAAEHNLYPTPLQNFPIPSDTVNLKGPLHFKQIAALTEIDENTLALLNPSLKQHFIPQSLQTFQLRIPNQYVLQFDKQRDTIIALAQSIYNPKQTAPETHLALISEELAINQTEEPQQKQIKYTVKKGDNLGTIARRYGVTASEVKSWNGIRNNIIRVGQRLTINIEDADNTQMVAVNEPTKQNATTKNTKQVHVVKQGDTLFSISRKYANLSVDEIRKINNLKTNQTIKPGMKLVVSKG